MRRDLALELRRDEADAGAGVLQDEADLDRVQLGIGRYRRRAGVPDAVQDLEILDAVLRHDGDPVTRRDTAALTQGGGKTRRPLGEFAVG